MFCLSCTTCLCVNLDLEVSMLEEAPLLVFILPISGVPLWLIFGALPLLIKGAPLLLIKEAPLL